METLPPVLIVEKNKIASSHPWLILLDITLPDGPPATILHLVRNTENVILGSPPNEQEYTAINFDPPELKSSGQGDLPQIELRINDVTGVLQAYLEEYDGGRGSTIVITLVHAAYLAQGYCEPPMTFSLVKTHSDVQWVTFTLGAPNPLRRRFPLYRYIADHCPHTFNSPAVRAAGTYAGAECGYTGAVTSCKRTLAACQALGNSTRYGGCKGLSGGYIRVV